MKTQLENMEVLSLIIFKNMFFLNISCWNQLFWLYSFLNLHSCSEYIIKMIISEFYQNALQSNKCITPCIEHKIIVGFPVKTTLLPPTNSSKLVLQFHPLVERLTTVDEYRQIISFLDTIFFTCQLGALNSHFI